MNSTTDSNPPRKPLVGLRVIEAWCWLWVAVFATGVGMCIASWLQPSLLGSGNYLWSEALLPSQGMAFYIVSFIVAFIVASLEYRVFGSGGAPHDWGIPSAGIMGIVFLAFALIAMTISLGLIARKNSARRTSVLLSILGLLNSAITLAFFLPPTPDGPPVPFRWLAIHLLAILLCPWIVWYLNRPQIKEAFGVGKRSADQPPPLPKDSSKPGRAN